ncbi:hypothetical protein SFRURICE_013520 [Spodoptera frugiperda]|nr:hypothetical protein SFRURICE_013520 [Spodoptera frugiperda]
MTAEHEIIKINPFLLETITPYWAHLWWSDGSLYRTGLVLIGRRASFCSPSADPHLRWPEIVERSLTPGVPLHDCFAGGDRIPVSLTPHHGLNQCRPREVAVAEHIPKDTAVFSPYRAYGHLNTNLFQPK